MEQPNTKMNYLSLVMAAGAVVVCAATAGLSVLPNSSNISRLQQQVNALEQEKATLVAQLAGGLDNRARIDELDIGLTALAQVANIDHDKLGKAIGAIRAADAKRKIALALPGASEAAPANMPLAATTPAQPADATAPTPKPAPPAPVKEDEEPGDQALVSAPEAPTDNPFTAAMDRTATGDAAAPLTIAKTKEAPATQLTIAQVDSILAKRISENWYKPANAKDSLNAVIQVKMSRDGKVASVKIEKASGNDAFDNSVVNAVSSIMAIKEVGQLSEADYKKAYASRSIQFTPQMGG
ncbi:energy transducer TonB [Pseudomonas sp. MWU12-2323]|uniref:energy transducer TonB n=1 Tax=Pseudomonas sp. MWU12-2323 TaxID=2651296 RepID=UPI0015B7390B|nr:energy transducer TonB [Pseudomonas sp. MWU12-2323]